MITKADKVAHLEEIFRDSISVKQRVLDSHLNSIVEMADVVVRSLKAGGKLMLCGNGGSAADAQHLAAELLVRLRPQINRPGIAALSLATDTSSLTACGNDYSYEDYFERQVRALGRPGDVLIGITTSGKSANIIRALAAAREMKIATLGFLGDDGGPALSKCDLAFVVPSAITGRIQESHITAGHGLMELIEDMLVDEPVKT